MISLQQVSVQYSGTYLFEEISFLINPRDRVGLVGKNGAGKSTLLKVLSGFIQPESGLVATPNGFTIGFLHQDLNTIADMSVVEEARKAFVELNALQAKWEEQMTQIETATDYESDSYFKLLENFAATQERLDMIGAGNVEGEIEKILFGLGFSRSDLDRNIQEFSGGWKMRVELAKILLQKPNTLLLDEPTNHLDIESIQWLEDFLTMYPGAVILVSHDKAFLDKVTNRTIEITLGKIEDYKAPYSKYLELRAERREQQKAAYENQQKQIEKTEEFIDRFRYKASKSVQVQSRIKQLNKVERLEIEEEDNAAIRFRFQEGNPSGKVVFRIQDVTKHFGDKQIFNDVDFSIERGDKLAFVGKNGEGKSTLAKIITGNLAPTKGEVETGYQVKIGYFAQDQDKRLDIDKTVFEVLDEVATGEVRLQLRSILGAFLFSGDNIDKKVKVLSGGERGRLALARLLLEPYNVLLLDEPTNHLDMRSKEVLKDAINQYKGTVIIVSHDREFLDGLCNKIYEFGGGKVKEFIGSIYEFLEYKKMDTLTQLEMPTTTPIVAKPETFNKPAPAAPKVDTSTTAAKQLKNTVQKLEQEIQDLETEIKKLETIANNAQELAKQPSTFFATYQQKKKTLDTKMEQWAEYSEQL